MSRLLCATDLLPKSEAAIDRAGMLAQQLQAPLSLLHVVSPTTSEHNLEQALQLAITGLTTRARGSEWRFDPPSEVAVRTGSPSRLILDSIEKQRVVGLSVCRNDIVRSGYRQCRVNTLPRDDLVGRFASAKVDCGHTIAMGNVEPLIDGIDAE